MKTRIFSKGLIVAISGLVASCASSPADSTVVWPPESVVVPPVPAGTPRSLAFQRVELPDNWGFWQDFDFSTHYRGIIRSEAELAALWSFMVEYDDPARANPPMPFVDFAEHSLIWYAEAGSFSVFVDLDEVLEFENVIEAHVTIHKTDYADNSLHLWRIDATDMAIRFVETKHSDGGI